MGRRALPPPPGGWEKAIGDAIQRLKQGLEGMGFADARFRNSTYMRLKMLEAHRDAGRLDADLRWTDAP